MGNFSHWRKLSIAVNDNPSILSDANRNWTLVTKQRQLEFYRWDESIYQWQRTESDDDATQVEWSQIVVNGQTHWTFALESPARPLQSRKRQRIALEMLRKERMTDSGSGAVGLKLQMSYPQWLCRFHAGASTQGVIPTS